MPQLDKPKLRVFLVEDSPEIADSLAEALAASGSCEAVGRADTEQGALDWSFAHEAGFDVAIVDLILRDGSGFGVLAHLTKYQPAAVVVLSGFVTPSVAERCKALGAAAAFPKATPQECIQFVTDLAAAKRGQLR
jgi:DNA-binding NarL/FixJ family response regulator